MAVHGHNNAHAETSANAEPVFAGFWIRSAAVLVDTLWLGLLIYVPLWLVHRDELFNLMQVPSLERVLFEWVLPIVVVLGFWAWKGATPAKMLFRLQIVDSRTMGVPSTAQFVIRYLGYFLSTAPLMLGFFWAGWDRQKQAWHDKLACTVVVVRSADSEED